MTGAQASSLVTSSTTRTTPRGCTTKFAGTTHWKEIVLLPFGTMSSPPRRGTSTGWWSAVCKSLSLSPSITPMFLKCQSLSCVVCIGCCKENHIISDVFSTCFNYHCILFDGLLPFLLCLFVFVVLLSIYLHSSSFFLLLLTLFSSRPPDTTSWPPFFALFLRVPCWWFALTAMPSTSRWWLGCRRTSSQAGPPSSLMVGSVSGRGVATSE